LYRPYFIVLAVTVFLLVQASPPAVAQSREPDVTAIYQGLKDRRDFAFIHRGTAFIRPVGLLTWVVPPELPAPASLERDFRSFCAEPLVLVTVGQSCEFAFDSIDDPIVYGLEDDEAGRAKAATKAKYLRELYSRYYADTLPGSPAGPDARAAFQVALWEILSEDDVPENGAADGPVPFNLFTGTFQANAPNETAAPPFVRMAQQNLLALTGDDSGFMSSPLLAGSEIVRLTGLPQADGAAMPQSQLMLRVRDNVATGGGGQGGLGGLFDPIGPGSVFSPLGFSPQQPGGAGGGGLPFIPGGGGVPVAPGSSLVAPGNGNSPPGTPGWNVLPFFPRIEPGAGSGQGPGMPPSIAPPIVDPGGGYTGGEGSGSGGSGSGSSGSSGGSGSGSSGSSGGSGSGGGSSGSSGGEGGGTSPLNPVPAPNGLVLGLIGLGTLGFRRWLRKASCV
jgi:hypothetical protein